MHGDKIRRHQTPNAAFRITEERLRHPAFLWREQPDELARRRARHFFKQCRAIVRRHFVQNRDDLFVRHRPQQILLLLDADVFKNIRRQCCRQHPEDNHLLVFRKIENHVGDIGRRPIGKQFAQRPEIARVDHALDLGC